MSALYNEIEPFACDWLENLAAKGHIANGRVDRRSIKELVPNDVRGAGQTHFFAGIGAWSYALRLAEVPDDFSVWTGSCPCQPFSAAGRGRGVADERHLWPEWFRLIRECRPPVLFGEQVASGPGLGWLDAVSADLEGEGYAVGAADLCAAGVGAPHRRQRLFFVAYADATGLRELGRAQLLDRQRAPQRNDVDGRGEAGELGNADDAGLQGHGQPVDLGGSRGRSGPERHRAAPGFWGDAEWVPCSDGKARPIEPGSFPLAHGAPARVGRLRAYGNAIVPQVAAAFIRAALEAIQ